MDPLAQAAVRRAQAALTVAVGGTQKHDLARDYVRMIVASALARSAGEHPHDYARNRWGPDSRVIEIMRSGISATGESDMGIPGAAAEAFFELALEASIAGKLSRARKVGFNTRTITPSAGATGYWVGEKQPVPVSRLALTGDALPSRKVAGLVILSKESLADPQSEDRVTADLLRAVAGVLDQALVADQVGTANVPAGILEGVTPTASSGDVVADFEALLASFSGDLRTSSVISDATTAVQLALTGGAAFQNLGANGGMALGLPWITSSSLRDSTGGTITLLDEAGLALALAGVEIKQSTAATVEADDEPTGEGSGPTAQSASTISLFQLELVAFLATIFANWRVVRAGSVAAISGANYSSAT